MSDIDDKIRPERELTDDSLGAERKKTDAELATQRERVEEDADEVVSRARHRADEVLAEARVLADEKTKNADSSVRRAQQEERARDDDAIEDERATADVELDHERTERDRALKGLLRFERESTDGHLGAERVRSDDVVAARDDFLGMVSHDLRTLLGGIALQAALLTREASKDELGGKVLKKAETIQRLTARMNRLIGDLLDVVSMEAGKFALVAKPEQAIRLVRDTVEAFAPSAAAAGITLTSEVADDALLGQFDYGRVLQVLANLVSNALKFTPASGHILLRAEAAGDAVQFSVTDTGPGLPESMHKAVFDRFVQATPDTRKGLGLGLYISRCIVEAHGGNISISRSSAEGSTFCFTLPKAEADSAHTERA